MKSLWSAIQTRWEQLTDGAGLALIRIAAALSVLIELLEICVTDRITEMVVDPQVQFKYAFFAWVARPQGLMPYVFAWVLVAFAFAVVVGWRTRWTATLLAIGYCYWFLLDATNYTDHRYLVCLLLILSAWLPSNRWASADAYMGRETRTQVPGWTTELLRWQLVLVYFFFGLSLLNRDWLQGAPLIAWVEVEAEDNFLVRFLSGQASLVRAFAWGIAVLHLVIGPLLMWHRSRLAALLVISLFQLYDQFTFQLSVSPLLLTAANLIFCDPAKLRFWGNRVTQFLGRIPFSSLIWKGVCKAGLIIDACVSWFDDTPLLAKSGSSQEPRRPAASAASAKKPVEELVTSSGAPQWAIVAWLLIQIWMPARYITIESRPDWTDLASTFAWRGQHRDKQCELKLSVVQYSQELKWPLDPADEFPIPMAIFYREERLADLGLSEGILKDLVSGPPSTLPDRIGSLKLPDAEAKRILDNYEATVKLRLSVNQYEQMIQRPELLRQYARRIGEVLSRILGEHIQVHADLMVKLNHRPAEPLFRTGGNPDLSMVPNAYDLANRLTTNNSPLPETDERIALAKEWAEIRRIELEQNYDIVSPKRPRQKGEPAKLPPLSESDEQWFREKYGMK